MHNTMTDTNESLLRFPCAFPIKIMGRATAEFELTVVSLVRKHAPDLSEGAVTTRASKQANYVSVTITVTAHSQAQLDAIYRELTACSEVLMVL